MLPFTLLLVPLLCRFFSAVNEVYSHKKKDNLIWHWRSGGLLNVVGWGYVLQLLWKWILIIVGNCFVMWLRETTMKKWSVSENSRNDLLKIASTINSHLIEGPQQRTYLPLMRLKMEIHFLLAVHFNFLVLFLPLQLSELFPTWLSTLPQQYLLDLRILPKKKKLNREGDTTGLLEVTVHGSCLMEKYASREAFGYAMDLIGSTRGCTIVKNFIVIVLKCIMTPSFVSLDMFVVWIVHNNDDCLG